MHSLSVIITKEKHQEISPHSFALAMRQSPQVNGYIKKRFQSCLVSPVWFQSSMVSVICGLNPVVSIPVWSQSSMVSITCGLNPVWSQSCVVSIQCRLSHVWSQSSMVSVMCGLNPVWSQSHVVTVQWSQYLVLPFLPLLSIMKTN